MTTKTLILFFLLFPFALAGQVKTTGTSDPNDDTISPIVTSRTSGNGVRTLLIEYEYKAVRYQVGGKATHLTSILAKTEDIEHELKQFRRKKKIASILGIVSVAFLGAFFYVELSERGLPYSPVVLIGGFGAAIIPIFILQGSSGRNILNAINYHNLAQTSF